MINGGIDFSRGGTVGEWAGKFFKPARELFILCGFKVCKPFAHYKEDINSVYMDLTINN